MKITLNGEERTVNEGSTIAALLADLNIQAKLILAERNGTPIDRENFDAEALEESDTIELIRLMGGG